MRISVLQVSLPFLTALPSSTNGRLGVATRVRERRQFPRVRSNSKPPPEEPSIPEPSSASTKEPLRTNQISLPQSELTALRSRIHALEDALQTECTARQELKRLLATREPSIVDEEEGDSRAPEEHAASARELSSIISREAAACFFKASLGSVHPLLTPHLLDIKKIAEILASSANEVNGVDDPNVSDSDPTSEMIDAFGTLAIHNGDSVQFLGASATEVCLINSLS